MLNNYAEQNFETIVLIRPASHYRINIFRYNNVRPINPLRSAVSYDHLHQVPQQISKTVSTKHLHQISDVNQCILPVTFITDTSINFPS